VEVAEIWVITILYDYGVWDDAGFFTTQEKAEAWIITEHEKTIAEWQEFFDSTNGPKNETVPLTQFKATRLEANKE